MLPVKLTLACATRTTVIVMMTIGTILAGETERTRPRVQHLRHRADQVDLRPGGMKQSTEPVPRMNMAAMMGAAITTERPDRAHRIAALAGDDRHVLEAAERAEAHLAKDVQIQQRAAPGSASENGTRLAATCPCT